MYGFYFLVHLKMVAVIESVAIKATPPPVGHGGLISHKFSVQLFVGRTVEAVIAN